MSEKVNKSKAYPGWIEVWDTTNNSGFYISPKGRIADYPGGPFYGQVSKEDLKSYKKQLSPPKKQKKESADMSFIESNSKELQVSASADGTVVVVRDGDVTITISE